MQQKHTFSLLSILRTNKQNNEGCPVYLRITTDGQRSEISTKVYVQPDKWHAGKGRVKGSSDRCRYLNNSIEIFEHRAREIYNLLIQQGKIVSSESIKNSLLGLNVKRYMLIENFEIMLTDIKRQEGLNYAQGTLKNWTVTLGHLKEFLRKQYFKSDIALKELDLKFTLDFQTYAIKNWGCRSNAVIKHIQRIRKVVNNAIANNWIDKDPFYNYKCKQEKTNRTFLTQEELDRIETKVMPIERLEKVRDIFIFSCYTGLAYTDIEKLTLANLVIGIDKEKWIYTFRTKTGIKSNIPLLPAALNVIQKYKHDPQSINKERLLPVITNIKTNAYLKEIADMCGIKKNLTFHMARHTFATTLTLSNGVPIETVSKMLGHSKITTTQIYAKVLETKVSEDMMSLRRKLSGIEAAHSILLNSKK